MIKWNINMFKWFKKLRSIVANYDNDFDQLNSEIKRVETIIIDRTDINADVHFKGSRNTAIMIGRFKNQDYIQTFDMEQYDFEGIINWLRDLKQHGHVRYIDAPPIMKIVVDKEKL